MDSIDLAGKLALFQDPWNPRVIGAVNDCEVKLAKLAGEFCWHIDVVPRLAQLAGLEMGTGLALNIVPPEVAAAQLRDA